jgi:hypothetical protein
MSFAGAITQLVAGLDTTSLDHVALPARRAVVVDQTGNTALQRCVAARLFSALTIGVAVALDAAAARRVTH